MQLPLRLPYPFIKLHEQKTAQLIHVKTVNCHHLPLSFAKYDTSFKDKHTQADAAFNYFRLRYEEAIMLVFLGNDSIPFTHLEEYSPEAYYQWETKCGRFFDIMTL